MTIPGFWQNLQRPTNNQLVVGDYRGMINNVHYLFPQGAGSQDYGPGNQYTTFADLKSHIRSRDLIILGGVLREQAITPAGIYDVSVIGASGNPRQATDGGVATGGGATWMAPTTPVSTTPLLEVIRQGWSFNNIAFNPHTASAALRFTTAGGLAEASQAIVDGCTFMGGGTTQIGIEDNGGSGFVIVRNNVFDSLGDTAIKGLTTATAIPRRWQILNNSFGLNLNDIKMSLSHALIQGNNFTTAGSGSTNKVVSTIALSGQGLNNHVILNFFHNTTGEIQISNGYSGATTDMWSNYCIGTAALIITSPPGA